MNIPKEIIDCLVSNNKTVSTAESFTSGGIGLELTSVSGSSSVFKGGLIAYDTNMKIKFLGVSKEDIDNYDVVSEQVVRQMVIGACKMFGSDYAIASTGYAEGGSDKVESNTRYVACGNKIRISVIKLCNKSGSRRDNTEEGILSAISLFFTYLAYE